VLKDERTGKELRLEAQSFIIDGYCAPRSGVFLDAVINYGGTKVKQSAVIMKPYSLKDAEDAETTARIVIADFIERLASLMKSLRGSERGRAAEWRLYVQFWTSRLYYAAQNSDFPLDVLEDAARFGQYCELLRVVFLYFFAGSEHCYADRLQTIAASLLDCEEVKRRRRLFVTL